MNIYSGYAKANDYSLLDIGDSADLDTYIEEHTALRPNCIVEDFVFVHKSDYQYVFRLSIGEYTLDIKIDHCLAEDCEQLRRILRHTKEKHSIDIEIAKRVLELNKKGVMPINIHEAQIEELKEEVDVYKNKYMLVTKQFEELQKKFSGYFWQVST